MTSSRETDNWVSDYYQLLEVDRDAGAEEIKRAYRRLARQYHPDVNGNDPASAERFKEINKAYKACPTRTSASATTPKWRGRVEVARRPGRRPVLALRRLLRRPAGPVLRRRRPLRRGPLPTRSRARRGETIGMRLRLPFTEAVFGTSKDVRVRAAASLLALQRVGGQAGHRADRLLALQRLRPAAHRPPVAARPAGHGHHLLRLLGHRPGDPLARPESARARGC